MQLNVDNNKCFYKLNLFSENTFIVVIKGTMECKFMLIVFCLF